jgi:hypothetical protein
MKTSTELIDWMYEIWVNMIIPDEIEQECDSKREERDD